MEDSLPPGHMCQQPSQGGQVSLVRETRQEDKVRPTKELYSGVSGVQSTAFCLLGTFDFLTHSLSYLWLRIHFFLLIKLPVQFSI